MYWAEVHSWARHPSHCGNLLPWLGAMPSVIINPYDSYWKRILIACACRWCWKHCCLPMFTSGLCYNRHSDLCWQWIACNGLGSWQPLCCQGNISTLREEQHSCLIFPLPCLNLHGLLKRFLFTFLQNWELNERVSKISTIALIQITNFLRGCSQTAGQAPYDTLIFIRNSRKLGHWLASSYLVVNAGSFAAIPFLLLKVQAKGMSSTNCAGVMMLADQYKEVNLRLTRGEASGLVVTCGWNAGAANFGLIIRLQKIVELVMITIWYVFNFSKELLTQSNRRRCLHWYNHKERKLGTPRTASKWLFEGFV